MAAWVLFGLRLLERLQDPVPDRLGVSQRLQARSEALEFVVAEVALSGTRSQDQVVVGDRYIQPIRRSGDDAALLLLHAGYFSEEHRRVPLSPDELAERRGDLPRGKDGDRHLVEQGLKDVVVVPVDQNDLRRRATESLDGSQATKASTDNDNSW